MANSIQILTHFVPILDEKYQKESLTAILDTPEAQLLENGKLKLPKITMSGFRNHLRSNGGQYKNGAVNFETVEVAPEYDRSIKFTVDYLDNTQTADIAYGRLAEQFMKHEEVPETDAYRFAKYAQLKGAEVVREAKFTTGAQVITALRKVRDFFDNAKVPETERILYALPEYINLVEDMQTIESRAALNSFAKVVKVPADLFMDEITLLDTEAGGFSRPATAKSLNLIGIHKSAIIQGNFHRAPKYIPADVNQDADGHAFAHRVSGIVHIFSEKTQGVYVSALPKA